MTYQEVLDYLYARLPMYQRIGSAAFKKDLSNTIKLCDCLGNPQEKFKSVHIAGTNGKGSSSHMIAAVLQKAGYKTGLYTSPHLRDFSERIRINGIPITREEIIDFTGKIKPEIEKTDPSFFELTVAMAFDHFARHKVDIAVIETGLGGRFDSTNVIVPLVSLITNISYDHQDLLGDTLQQIAFEKAGIIKPGIDAVIGERDPETENVFIKKADDVKAPLFFAQDHYRVIDQQTEKIGNKFIVRKMASKEDIHINPDLPGDYQVKNLPGVLTLLDLLGQKNFVTGIEDVKQGIENTRALTGIRGRWEVLSDDPLIICDVGHNEDGIRWVVKQLIRIKRGNLHIIFGMVKDKKSGPILSLLPTDANYYFCQANIPRARNAAELAKDAGNYGLKGPVIPDVNKALSAAIERYAPGDVIFIGGSTFVVAEISRLN